MNTSFSVEKLCEGGRCGNFTESSFEANHVLQNEKASCSSNEMDNIISNRLSRCDYYNVSHTECITWVEEELERSCGGRYSCIESARGDWSSWKKYSGMSDK